MTYIIKGANGKPRIYDRNLWHTILRAIHIAAKEMMNLTEISIPIFNEQDQIVAKVYFKEILDRKGENILYLCYEKNNVDGSTATFRSYYDAFETIKSKDMYWVEVVSMRNRQLLAKDVY